MEDLSCPVCQESYSEAATPRTFRCGHTICTPCLDVILDRPKHERNCPECRMPLHILKSATIPVTYTILRAACSLAKHGESVQARFSEETESLQSCIETLNDLCLKVVQLQSQLEVCDAQYGSEIDSTATKLKYLQQKRQEVQEGKLKAEEKAHEMQTQLVTLSNLANKLTTLKHHPESVSALAQVGNCGISVVALQDDAAQLLQSYSKLTPMFTKEVLKQLVKQVQTMFVSIEDTNNKMRLGRITISGTQVFLHSIVDSGLPKKITEGAIVLPFQYVKDFIPEHRANTFLDVYLNNRYEGRIFLEMYGNCSRGQGFVTLCSGEAGVSFKGSKLFSTVNKSFSLGIDSIQNTTHDGRVLLSGFNDSGIMRKPIHPGFLSATVPIDDEEDNNTYYQMYTQRVNKLGDCCGRITSGLSILRSERDDQRCSAEISDCGVVLSF